MNDLSYAATLIHDLFGEDLNLGFSFSLIELSIKVRGPSLPFEEKGMDSNFSQRYQREV